jgi:hypothetical protein
MIVATLSPEKMAQGSIAGATGVTGESQIASLLITVAGMAILGGGVVAMGFVWRRRR